MTCAKREQPGLDDKVLAGWNGLMIAGLAEAGIAIGEPAFLEAAGKAASFVLTQMRDERGDLLRVWREGKAETPGVFEDYALMIRGLLALHGVTNEARWRDAAVGLTKRAEELFGAEDGGWYDAPAGRNDLIVRLVSTRDGAVPSATSVMLGNVLALRDVGFEDVLGRGIASLSSEIVENPLSTVNSVRVLFEIDEEFREKYGVGASAPTGAAWCRGITSRDLCECAGDRGWRGGSGTLDRAANRRGVSHQFACAWDRGIERARC